MKHVDPLDDNKQMAFTNVILQCAPVTQYDSNGYMQFNILNSTGEGYYITGGKAIPVNDITRKAVPQFLMSRGSVNVSLSTKIADVAIIREIQIATTEDIIIPK